MRALFPLLFLLVCPVMMFFMMRGMHGGGRTTGAGADGAPDRNQASHPPPGLPAPVGHAEARIAELEREVAKLRAEPSRDAR